MARYLFRKYFPWFLFLFGFLMLVWFIRAEEREQPEDVEPTPASHAAPYLPLPGEGILVQIATVSG